MTKIVFPLLFLLLNVADGNVLESWTTREHKAMFYELCVISFWNRWAPNSYYLQQEYRALR